MFREFLSEVRQIPHVFGVGVVAGVWLAVIVGGLVMLIRGEK